MLAETSTPKHSTDFIALLERLDEVYGRRPGGPDTPVVMVIDNRPIHTSKASTAALAAGAWLTPEWLPKYAPDLNDMENGWPTSSNISWPIKPSTRPRPWMTKSIAPYPP